MAELCYDDDEAYPIQEYDEVEVVAGEVRFPGVVKKVFARKGQVLVSFEGIDPVLDLIMLRKSARVPAKAIQLVGRSM